MTSPNTSNSPRFIPRALVPTLEQTRIQLSQDKVVLIDANAGAAKTTTLALRIGEALARGLAPEQMLALVFTPEARDVMRQRLVDVGIAGPVALRVKVATVEEFAAEALARIDAGDAPAPAGTRELAHYARHAVEEAGERYRGRYDGFDPKTHNIAISQFLDIAQGLKATMALEGDFEELGMEEAAAILNVPLTDYLTTLEYERIRLGSFEGTLFRGPYDASYDLARLLGQNGELTEELPSYRVVLCDELHDMNEAAFRILTALLAGGQCYFIGAGDKDQVIHSRLGASVSFIRSRFAAAFPGLARYPLTQSYRYGPHLAYAMAAFKRKEVNSELPLPTAINELTYAEGEDGAAAVVATVRDWGKKPLGQVAVLLRHRDQSVSVENALLAAGIAYRTQEMPSYLQRSEILFLRGMVAIALKNLDSVKLDATRRAIVAALTLFGEVDLSDEELAMAQKTIARDPDTLAYFFSGKLQQSADLAARARVSAVVAYAEGAPADAGAAGVLREICRLLDLEAVARRLYVHPYEARVVTKTVAGFIAAAERSGLSLREFSEWIGGAERHASGGERHALLLESVANAKGREFEHVILPYLEQGEFPNPLFGLGEEENLFYVAATRARSRLTLIAPREAARRSPFIARLDLQGTLARADAAVKTNAASAAAQPASAAATSATRGTARSVDGATAGQGSGSTAGRRDLRVPFAEKDQAKALGAEWDPARRVWFVKAGMDLAPFARWLKE
jgi:DNA helicase-2/ATP-dependent DNA helicase PcrA